MAVERKRVFLANPTGQQLFYTVPTGKKAMLRNLVLSNDTASLDVVQGLILNGAGFVWDTKVADQYTPNLYQLATVLSAGDTLRTASSVNPSYCQVDLVEFDPSDMPTTHRVDFFSVEALKSYTVPTGKKFRIREIVIAPHSISTTVNCYIGGIGYIFRGNVVGYKPVVEQMDLTAYAGENVAAVAGAGPVHVFVSGTLEDA